MAKLAVKEQVASIARLLYERQMVNTNEGNVSVLDEDLIYITPSQVCKGLLTPEMIVVTDREGKVVDGGGKPSSEILLHMHIYNLRPDVRGVVHDHSPFATAHAIARKPIKTSAYMEAMLLYDYIPLAEYGAAGTPAITRDIGRFVHQTDVMLLANHGVVAYGKTVREAYERAEAVETIAKTLTITKILGGEHPLSDDELKELYELRQQNFGKGRIHE